MKQWNHFAIQSQTIPYVRAKSIYYLIIESLQNNFEKFKIKYVHTRNSSAGFAAILKFQIDFYWSRMDKVDTNIHKSLPENYITFGCQSLWARSHFGSNRCCTSIWLAWIFSFVSIDRLALCRNRFAFALYRNKLSMKLVLRLFFGDFTRSTQLKWLISLCSICSIDQETNNSSSFKLRTNVKRKDVALSKDNY